MVQYDANTAIGLSNKRPSLVDSGESPLLVGKVDIAHGGGKHAVELDHLIADLAGFPRLDGKTFVVGIVGIAPHKIGQGTCLGRSERLRIRGEGRFEGDGPILIGIGLI